MCVKIALTMSDKPLKIFFSGIGGSGLSAIACFMADKGHTVSGSDRAFDVSPSHPLKKILTEKEITLFPQDGSGIDSGLDLTVFSTAVDSDRPEAGRARELGIPITSRPEYLTEITSSYHTIAVSGTSGKSTSSGLLAFLMHNLGMSPNFIGGGRVKQFRTPSHPGSSLSGISGDLVIEACESDGTIVNYRPDHSIILNLSLDHNPVRETAEMFKTLIAHTRVNTIINNDDKYLKTVTDNKSSTFSLHSPSDYRAENVRFEPFHTRFTVNRTQFSLSLPGRHNLYNALSCIAMLSELGISLDDVASVLHTFNGIDRRFDIHLNSHGNLVIDDYAHNPHKISALMETMKPLGNAICYIFQPHGFGPTRMMRKEYIEVFTRNLRETDHLVLLPIFYAGGNVSRDISSYDLADEIKNRGKSVEVIQEREEIIKAAGAFRTYAVFGARDESLSDLAEDIARSLSIEE
jgi:UDP-N-acetylmuramate--alanine ligase